jgi:hypothetical protein
MHVDLYNMLRIFALCIIWHVTVFCMLTCKYACYHDMSTYESIQHTFLHDMHAFKANSVFVCSQHAGLMFECCSYSRDYSC